MPSIKKINEEYYYCVVYRRRKGTREHKKIVYKHIFLVKHATDGGGYISGSHKNPNVSCPEELIGKRVMLKVVEVEG